MAMAPGWSQVLWIDHQTGHLWRVDDWSRFSLAINLFTDSPTGILMLINCASPPASSFFGFSATPPALMLACYYLPVLPDPFISNHHSQPLLLPEIIIMITAALIIYHCAVLWFFYAKISIYFDMQYAFAICQCMEHLLFVKHCIPEIQTVNTIVSKIPAFMVLILWYP